MHHSSPGGSGTHKARSAAPEILKISLLLHTHMCTYELAHMCTHTFSQPHAHLVSRMAVMNADLLAAGTGRLLVLMTGTFLVSQDENGERMQNRGSHRFYGVTQSIQQELHMCVNKWPKGGWPIKGPGGQERLPRHSASMCQAWLPPKNREVTAISPIQEWVRVPLPIRISQ